ESPGEPRSRMVHRLRARRVADDRARRAGRARRRRRWEVRGPDREADPGTLLHARRRPAAAPAVRRGGAPARAASAGADPPSRPRPAGGARGAPLSVEDAVRPTIAHALRVGAPASRDRGLRLRHPHRLQRQLHARRGFTGSDGDATADMVLRRRAGHARDAQLRLPAARTAPVPDLPGRPAPGARGAFDRAGRRRLAAMGPARCGFGSVPVQRSEFAKLAMVLVCARYWSITPPAKLGLREAAIPLLLMALPAAAILAQPDLGSAALIVLVSMTMLVIGGVQIRWLALLASPAVLLAPPLWSRLKEDQQRRILTLMDPAQDPPRAGHHVVQSKIAVGSGMLWGKGFLHGTQNHLSFLPEQHTDFIFSVFSEEWGLIGCATLMTLYLAILLRGTVIAARARNRFGALLVM